MLQRIVDIEQARIITDVEVSTWNPAEAIAFRGLIDTGTQQSGISQDVIDALGNGSDFVPHGFDVLVGMDLIERFAVGINNGTCTLRLRS